MILSLSSKQQKRNIAYIIDEGLFVKPISGNRYANTLPNYGQSRANILSRILKLSVVHMALMSVFCTQDDKEGDLRTTKAT